MPELNGFCPIDMQQMWSWSANYIIKIHLAGIIGDNVVELENPESKPVYLLC